MSSNNCEDLFYLIGPGNTRLIPYVAHSRSRGTGYQLTPSGFQNSLDHADFTEDLKEMVQAVVQKGLAVRVLTVRAGRVQRNAVLLGARAAPRYWLHHTLHYLVAGATHRPSSPVARKMP